MSTNVIYYNEKARAVISRQEIIDRIAMRETNRWWHQYVPPKSWDKSAFTEPEIQTFCYRLEEIPLHPDWITITTDDLTLDVNEYEYLLDLVHKEADPRVSLKLMNNIQRIKEYRYKGINIY